MYDDPSGHWALWDNFKESVSDFANDVKDTVTEGYNKVKDKVVEVYNDAKDFVEEKIEQAKEFVQDVSCQATIKAAEAAVDVFGADNVTKTVNTVNNTVKQAKQWVDDKWEQACEFSQDKLGIDLERTVNGVMKVVNTVGTVAAAVTAFSVAMAATGGLALVAAPVLMGFASVSAVHSVAEGIEGLQDVYYGMQGDSETQSFNFVRDTIYADNPELYYQHKAIADTGTQMLTGFVGGLNARASSKSSITETTSAPKCNNPPTQCFVAGTQVLTPDGNVNIEDIQAGDIVIATDPETGETEEKEVVETYVNETEELIYVWVDGEEIITTPTHPFYVPEKGWTSAVELKAGDWLQLVNGECVIVEKVQHELLEEPVKVYNFQVEDFHTYYVGSNISVLVHNLCGDDSNKSTFYQVTSRENATKIMEEGKLTGKEFKEVYAWTEQPTLKQAKASGARDIETVISFEVNPNTFVKDTTVAENLQDIARVSSRPGPIEVSNVKEVGFKKEWWQFWKK